MSNSRSAKSEQAVCLDETEAKEIDDGAEKADFEEEKRDTWVDTDSQHEVDGIEIDYLSLVRREEEARELFHHHAAETKEMKEIKNVLIEFIPVAVITKLVLEWYNPFTPRQQIAVYFASVPKGPSNEDMIAAYCFSLLRENYPNGVAQALEGLDCNDRKSLISHWRYPARLNSYLALYYERGTQGTQMDIMGEYLPKHLKTALEIKAKIERTYESQETCVIGETEEERELPHLHLRDANLERVRISNMNLSFANFIGAENISRGLVSGVNDVSGADFSFASLRPLLSTISQFENFHLANWMGASLGEFDYDHDVPSVIEYIKNLKAEHLSPDVIDIFNNVQAQLKKPGVFDPLFIKICIHFVRWIGLRSEMLMTELEKFFLANISEESRQSHKSLFPPPQLQDLINLIRDCMFSIRLRHLDASSGSSGALSDINFEKIAQERFHFYYLVKMKKLYQYRNVFLEGRDLVEERCKFFLTEEENPLIRGIYALSLLDRILVNSSKPSELKEEALKSTQLFSQYLKENRDNVEVYVPLAESISMSLHGLFREIEIDDVPDPQEFDQDDEVSIIEEELCQESKNEEEFDTYLPYYNECAIELDELLKQIPRRTAAQQRAAKPVLESKPQPEGRLINYVSSSFVFFKLSTPDRNVEEFPYRRFSYGDFED